MPGSPVGGRGQPAFDKVAQEVIAQARGQQRRYLPPETDAGADYERAHLTDEERAEAARVAAAEAEICKYCIGVHRYPTTIACPRIAEADLNGEGRITRVRFREDVKWQQRVSLLEDMHEKAKDGDDGG